MQPDRLSVLVLPVVALCIVVAGAALITVHRPPSSADDRSSHSHRQLIGYTGLLLPLVLWLMSGLRPTPKLARWEPLGSVSAYYYTGGVTFFVGSLAALAAFLFTYQGYKNNDYLFDRLAGFVAGAAAIGVALFPTRAPDGSLSLSWWIRETGWVHQVSAGVLFFTFAFFDLVLFRKSDAKEDRSMPSDKRRRNRVYVFCGLVILLCIVWAVMLGRKDESIFWPETIALVSFASSWLVKGRAGWTIMSVGKSTLHYARNPKELITKISPTNRGSE